MDHPVYTGISRCRRRLQLSFTTAETDDSRPSLGTNSFSRARTDYYYRYLLRIILLLLRARARRRIKIISTRIIITDHTYSYYARVVVVVFLRNIKYYTSVDKL